MVECFDGAHQEYHNEVDIHTPGCLEECRWCLDCYHFLDQMVVADTGHCDTAQHQVVVGSQSSLEAADSIGHFVDSSSTPVFRC